MIYSFQKEETEEKKKKKKKMLHFLLENGDGFWAHAASSGNGEVGFGWGL